MKKAVFFDFYNTLVRFDPPREELHAWALAQVGINVSPQALRRALPAADEFYHREALRQPPAQRGPEELKAFYAQYEAKVLNGLGIEISPDLAYELIRLGGRFYENRVARVLMWPNLALQALTTRQPDDAQVEVALRALQEVMAAEGVQAAQTAQEAAAAMPSEG